jgi:peptidoglycan-N-acetylglucosamine deacetylase
VAVRVALTFDAEHPDRSHRPGVQEEMLDVLREREVRATFFLQGRWVEAFPETARRVVADGHLVGSHSFYHARLPLLSDDGLVTDTREAERAIRDIAGVDPRPWFRCPFFAGEDDPRVVGTLNDLGYRVVPADVVVDDWDPERTADEIVRDTLERCRTHGDGAIALLHTWPPHALAALPMIVDGLRAAGASLVDLTGLSPSRWEPSTVAADRGALG